MTGRRLSGALLLYVLPLALTAAFLASVGLGLLALALLAVEACVVAAVALSRREPRVRDRTAPRTHDGATVLLALGAGVVGVVVLLLVLRGGSA